MSYLQELKSLFDNDDKSLYSFKEQTLVYKQNNEYHFYISTVLEKDGYYRFDYAAFNIGYCPQRNNNMIISHLCIMKELWIPLSKNYLGQQTYSINEDIYNPIYTYRRTTIDNAF